MRRARRAPRRPAALLLCGLLCATVLAWSAAPLLPWPVATAPQAQAVPVAGDAVTVDITDLSPAAATSSDDTVTLTGTATNATATPLTRLQVLLWRNQAPYTDTEQFDQVLLTPPTEPVGARITDHPSGFVDLTRSDLHPDLPETLPSGASVTFRVHVTVAQLELPSVDGIYMIGAHVRGATSALGEVTTLGRGRTFLPVLSQPTSDPVPVTSVVTLTSRPSYLDGPDLGSGAPQNSFLDDHLAAEIANGGRLDVLLRSASRTGVSWAIDPELLQALEAMERGYRVGLDQDARDGTGQVAARRWLDRFDDLDTGEGYRLFFGNPDLAALARLSDGGTLLTRADRAGRQLPRAADLPLLALPADGLADATTIARADSARPSAFLVSAVSTGTRQVEQNSSGRPVISFDADAFAGGPGPEPQSSAVKVRQRMLAEAWLRIGTGDGIVRIITTEAEAAHDEAADAPYLTRRELGSLTAQVDRQTPQAAFSYPESASVRELSGAQLDRLQDLRRNYVAFADLLIDPGEVEDRIDAAIGRAASLAWRGDDAGQQAWMEATGRGATDVLGGAAISLGRDSKVVLTGSTGSFPLTVTNNLDVPVRVRVDVTSANNSRLRVKSVEQIEVQPGDRLSVQVEAKPAANGEVEVSAQLATLSGTKLGRPTTTTVQATEYGTVGWVIALGAGLAFMITTALRIRQVRRERAAHTGRPEQGDSPLLRTGDAR